MADLRFTDKVVGGGGDIKPRGRQTKIIILSYSDKKNLLVLQDENKTANTVVIMQIVSYQDDSETCLYCW